MDQVIKVTFPAYSRLQNEPAELSRIANRSIFFICLLVFPSLLGLILIAPTLTEVIPKYEKWQPALFALYIISINTIFAAVTTPLTNLLNAIGKIKITFRLMIMWTVLTWILIPILSMQFGLNGAATGYAIVGLSSLIAIYISSKFIKVNFWDSCAKPAIATIIMGLSIYAGQYYLPSSTSSIFIFILLGVLVYTGSIIMIVGRTILLDVQKILQNLR